jgi:hypothetical protein
MRVAGETPACALSTDDRGKAGCHHPGGAGAATNHVMTGRRELLVDELVDNFSKPGDNLSTPVDELGHP